MHDVAMQIRFTLLKENWGRETTFTHGHENWIETYGVPRHDLMDLAIQAMTLTPPVYDKQPSTHKQEPLESFLIHRGYEATSQSMVAERMLGRLKHHQNDMQMKGWE